jgi:hypothetical protein
MNPTTQHTSQPWQEFEDLVRRILEARGFSMVRHVPRGDKGFDLTGYLNNEQWAIEVKYYRTNRAQAHLVEAAAARVANRRTRAQRYRGMLVVSCILPAPMRLALEDKFGITFIDRHDLDRLASKDPLLTEELQKMLGSNLSPFLANDGNNPDELFMLSPVFRPESVNEVNDLFTQRSALEQEAVHAEDTFGTELCAQLRAVPAGKKGWSIYERVCANILKYLFPNDLEGWYKQKRTDDGLNRYDFVCRLRPTTDFWRFLIDHLNSRYVIFEFKNYTKKIAQGQILTTEKYLLERGLRRVAIILSRKGADRDALRVTQGAMREHGKLMLLVDDDMICKMLHMKERGEDPTDFLFELADDFLLSLPR